MVLKQYKRIKNTNELSKYDYGKDFTWGSSQQSYPGYNGWDWGKNNFGQSVSNTPKIQQTNVQTAPQNSVPQSNATIPTAGIDLGGAAFGIGSSAIGFAGSMFNSFGKVQSTQQLQNDAGTSSSSIDGIGYTRYNNIDKNREMKQVESENTSNTLGAAGSGAMLGASIGSIIPGLGTIAGGVIGGVTGLVGGLFGGASRKRKLRKQIYNAQQLTDRTNQFNRSDADTSALQQNYLNKYGNNDGQLLYANNGKDINYDIKTKYFFLGQSK